MREPKYKRVLLKISGEALAGDAHRGLDFAVIGGVCDVIKQCVEAGVQVGVVVGGGNFWRGVKDGGGKMERTRADHMGMLATVINALAVTLSYAELLVTNMVFFVLIHVCENNRRLSHVSCKLVLYDRVDLVLPERRAELVQDLQRRTGLTVVRIEVGAMDFLHDTAMLKVYYDAGGGEANTVDQLMRLPKTTEQ